MYFFLSIHSYPILVFRQGTLIKNYCRTSGVYCFSAKNLIMFEILLLLMSFALCISVSVYISKCKMRSPWPRLPYKLVNIPQYLNSFFFLRRSFFDLSFCSYFVLNKYFRFLWRYLSLLCEVARVSLSLLFFLFFLVQHHNMYGYIIFTITLFITLI